MKKFTLFVLAIAALAIAEIAGVRYRRRSAAAAA